MIKFNCRHCGTRISAGAEDAGRKAPCPSCGGDVVVPAAAEVLPVPSEVPPPLPQVGPPRAEEAPSPGVSLDTPPPLPPAVLPEPAAKTAAKPAAIWPLRQRLLVGLAIGCVFVLIKVLIVAAGLSGQSSSPAASAPPKASAEDQLHTWFTKMQGDVGNSRGAGCPACNGTGRVRNAHSAGTVAAHPDAAGMRMQGHIPTCRDCGGGGTIVTQSGYVVACRSCEGRGMPESISCPSCRGSGRL
jgi:hypothetical protein